MYDFYKTATVQVSLPYLSDMMTRQARENGILDEKHFMVVTSISTTEDGEEALTAECEVFKYLEN